MKNTLTRILSLVSVLAIITAFALTVTSCSQKGDDTAKEPPQSSSEPIVTSDPDVAELSFTCSVTLADGSVKEREYTYTDGQTVGEVMLGAGDIAGEQGTYGLYVKSVLGEEHDYDKDGSYWSFYIDGEYAMTGVDATKIESGKKYELKAEASK